MARKTSRPPTWLAVLQNAGTIFIGEAVVTGEEKVTAAQTSFRGDGYRLTAQVSPQQVLTGSMPARPVMLQGDTPRKPESRLKVDAAYFPPDDLRRVDYWDYAQAKVPQQVLVALLEPPFVRLLTSQADGLPQAVLKVLAWLRLPAEDQSAAVEADLSRSVYNPVAYVAGFELLMNQESDLPALFKRFNRFPGRPGAAIQGMVELLSGVSLSLSQPAVKALALKLLEAWKTEDDPAAISSYLLWFDAQRQRTWNDDPNMRKEVVVQAGRARGMSFSGEYAAQWEERVRAYASVLVEAK